MTAWGAFAVGVVTGALPIWLFARRREALAAYDALAGTHRSPVNWARGWKQSDEGMGFWLAFASLAGGGSLAAAGAVAWKLYAEPVLGGVLVIAGGLFVWANGVWMVALGDHEEK